MIFEVGIFANKRMEIGIAPSFFVYKLSKNRRGDVDMTKKMRAIVINGSPRKNCNTGILLRHAMEGAQSVGADTRLVNLYDLNYKGCISCFSCKLKGGKFAGQCAMRDDLTEVLDDVNAPDVLLLGSPIYIGDVTGAMRSFLERLIFMNLSYRKTDRSDMKGCVSTGFIYTMGIPDALVDSLGYTALFDGHARYLGFLKGKQERLVVTDAYQFDDYSKYDADLFDESKKAKIRDEQFPLDCKSAFSMGARLVETHPAM